MVRRYVEGQTLQPMPSARFEAADFGRAGQMIGEAVEGFGRAAFGAVADLDEIALKHDEAAVRQADAEDALRISEIKQKALAAQGMDAQSAIEQARKDIEALGRSRQESFSSRRQKAMYSDVFSRRQLGAFEALGDHAYKQVEVARQASLTATIESSATVAIDNHADTEEFERNMTALDEAIGEKYKGMPGNVVTLARRKARSAVHSGVVEKLMQDPDQAGEAAIYLKDHAAEIEPDEETKLWKQVNPYIDEERTMSDASWATSGAPMPGETEIDLPEPAGEGDTAPAEPAATTPAPAQTSARLRGFINPLGRGVGKITNTATQHEARGSGKAVDIAAKEGTVIRPPMSGKVIKNWWSEEGGWSVLIQHPNGYVTGYAHMRAKSPADVGEEVDNTRVIGAVGNTGSKSTGPHLHYTVRKSIDGPKEDPQTLAWVDKGAVDPKSANWKEAPLPKYEEEDTNVARALERLHDRATAENWSPRRYEKAAAEVRSRGAVNQQLFREQQGRLYDEAANAIAEADLAGKPLTTLAQVPNFHKLDPGNKARIKTALAANKKALENGGVGANGPIFLDLFQMSGEDPESFKSVDLRTVTGITPGERTRLVGIQKNMIGKDNEPSNFAAQHSRVYGMIDRFAGKGGAAGYQTGQQAGSTDKRRRAILFRAVADRVTERQTELKRPLTDDELEAIVRSQVVTVTRAGNQMPRYVAERTPKQEGEVDQIEVPRDKQAAIIQAYRRANNGRMPTQREVVARYLQYQSLGGR